MSVADIWLFPLIKLLRLMDYIFPYRTTSYCQVDNKHYTKILYYLFKRVIKILLSTDLSLTIRIIMNK